MNASEPIRLGPFQLGEKVGEGGMGAVYCGRHRETGVEVAVKVIRRPLAQDTQLDFHREVQAHAELIHPGIVYLFEYGEVDLEQMPASSGQVAAGSRYVAMELADRGTIRDAMPLTDWPTVRDILLQVLDALAHAHARGVIHRDLKPENLLVFDSDDGSESRVKLADFGIAHAFEQEANWSTQTLASASGTPYYMAPEQAHGRWRSYGPWTDLYALGCITWELVCGRPPFEADSPFATIAKHQEEQRPPLEPRFPVPDGLDLWIHRAMAVEPRDRFRRAADASRALEALDEPADSEETTQGFETIGSAPTLEADDSSSTTTRIDLAAPTLQIDSLADGSGRQSPDNSLPGAVDEHRSPELASPTVPETWHRPEPGKLPSPLVGTGLGLFGLRETPFVDRDSARDCIWEALRQVDQYDQPRVVLVVGESGAGKSRLVDWMATRAHELGAATIMRAVQTAGGEGPTEGLSGMVQRLLRGHRLERGEFYQHLLDQLPPLAEGEIDRETDARALTELVHPTSDDQEAVDGPRYRFSSSGQKYALVERLLRRYGRRRPPLVWLDDAQWSDFAMSLVTHLLESGVEQPPALVAVTLRSNVLAENAELAEHVDWLSSHEWCTRLDVAPLEATDHRQFVDRLLPLDERLADRIAERTEGNPLFASQLLDNLVERDALEPGADGFHLSAGVSVDLPDDIHDLWIQRLSHLIETLAAATGDPIWRVLERAAALGREVETLEWRAICRELGVSRPEALCDELVERGLADRTDQGWAFAHGLLVDSLERHAREAGCWRDHHRNCARLLADIYPERPRQTASRRAEHWIEAGELEEALTPLLEEYPRVRRQETLEEAREVLQRRRHLIETLDLPENDPRRLENDINDGICRLVLGASPADSLQEFVDLKDKAEEVGIHHLIAQAWRGMSWCDRKRGNLRAAGDHDHRAVRHARESGDEQLRLKVLTEWGWVELFRGELDEASRRFSQAIDCAETTGNRFERLRALRGLASVARAKGRSQRASALFQEGLAETREHGYRGLESEYWREIGELARFDADTGRARTCYRQSERLARELSRPSSVAISRVNLAQVELAARRFEIAEQRLSEGRQRLEDLSIASTYEHVLRLTDLTLSTARQNWSRFDERFAPYAEGWPPEARLESDHPWLLEMAGDYAAEYGESGRARRVWRLAGDLWERLDNDDAHARVTDKLTD